ncbi:hypothetical protein BLNAU_3038 [Blattamonas nauphoetae]|uniref:Uncharacterized protein n=1 Tax=Blattamonas nauphoetae TaxID=2049346 RepID=A0ABQ9YDZ9_9EUKA|nr:hypothetical protein BLNAU_3038 [Blattamonas nauphoetae]
MPPKHKLGRKHSKTQSDTRIQSGPSSKSNKTIVNSTIQNNIENDNESSLDRHPIPSATDILQNELRRKRISVEALLEKVQLEGDEMSLPASITSDWRLILQDSIATEDLRQGCISLFEQVNSGLNLTPNEVFRAVHFLKYATIHARYREYPHQHLLETIFPEEEKSQTKLTSALIKLVCHPSDKLRTAALTFFAVGLSSSSPIFTLAVAAAGLLPQLFKCLKPQEVPLNRTTIDFHRHITSIVDKFFHCPPFLFKHEKISTKTVDLNFKPCFNYLRYLLASPACPPDYPSGISLLSKMTTYDKNIKFFQTNLFHPDLEPFFSELRKTLTEELASSLDLTTSRETLHQLLFGERRKKDELGWTRAFPSILIRLSEGRHLSDLGLHAFLLFMSNRPGGVKSVLQPGGTFSIEVDGKVQATLELPTSFISALILTRPLYAAAILIHFHKVVTLIDPATLLMDLQIGWFSKLFDAVTPSKLPFTNEFLPLHTPLVRVMKEYLGRMRKYAESKEHDPSRSDLDEICLSFHKHTKEYLVHLSLHPFVLITQYCPNPILDFFTDFFGPDLENSVTKPFRDEVRKTMDEAALSWPSPFFILTSELVCRLTDEEIMKVVDRIVALLESDSPISDDTILRICAFHTNQLKCVYLPELFRKAGRSTEQYFYAFECLLSLPFDYFTLCPINCLLKPKPKTLQPTFDEWDDVDLSTVGVVMPTIHANHISFDSASSQLLKFAVEIFPQLSHCASRLNLSQLERLLYPSIDLFFKFYIQQFSSRSGRRKDQIEVFIGLRRLCEQCVIAQCLGRIGFFSRIVNGLLDDDLFSECKYVIDIFLRQARHSSDEKPDKKTLRRISRHFLEEGWQDVLDFLLVTKQDSNQVRDRIEHVMEMMQFHGVNVETI